MSLLKWLAAPVSGPIGGIVWLAEKIAEQVDHELYDEAPLQEQLVRMALAYDMGEITEEEYTEQEEALLARLKAIREHNRAEGGEG